MRKEIFKKKIPKSLWDLKTDVTFAPRKTGKFIERLAEFKKRWGEKKVSKFLKKVLAN